MEVNRIEAILGRPFTVRDLVKGYQNDVDTNHVSGFDGQLDIRPKYQRNFRYSDKQQEAVMNTILQKFPLNTMYWVKKADGTYEVLDGQQRTISICEYVCGPNYDGMGYPINVNGHQMTFANLKANMPDIAEDILDYPLEIYVCDGTDSEKLAWFRVINTAGETMTDQELRNAAYSGAWVSSAKAYFSREKGRGVKTADKDDAGKKAPLLSKDWNKQEYLETVLLWAADAEGKTIEEYMSDNQGKSDASELWRYFNSVVEWARSKFTHYRSYMKGLPWGIWYNECNRGLHKDCLIQKDGAAIEEKLLDLIADSEVSFGKGAYMYIVDGLEKHLNLRQFEDDVKMRVYEAQKHKCPYCEKKIDGYSGKDEYDITEMEADHIVPWHDGGKTTEENCQMLCKYHNGHKSGK